MRVEKTIQSVCIDGTIRDLLSRCVFFNIAPLSICIDDKNCYLAVGTLEKVPYKQQHVASYYQQLDPSIQVLKGHASIDAYIYNLLNATHTTAIRDYWEYWNAHGENENYGKVSMD